MECRKVSMYLLRENSMHKTSSAKAPTSADVAARLKDGKINESRIFSKLHRRFIVGGTFVYWFIRVCCFLGRKPSTSLLRPRDWWRKFERTIRLPDHREECICLLRVAYCGWLRTGWIMSAAYTCVLYNLIQHHIENIEAPQTDGNADMTAMDEMIKNANVIHQAYVDCHDRLKNLIETGRTALKELGDRNLDLGSWSAVTEYNLHQLSKVVPLLDSGAKYQETCGRRADYKARNRDFEGRLLLIFVSVCGYISSQNFPEASSVVERISIRVLRAIVRGIVGSAPRIGMQPMIRWFLIAETAAGLPSRTDDAVTKVVEERIAKITGNVDLLDDYARKMLAYHRTGRSVK